MTKFAYGAGEPIEVQPENVAQFEAAGWSEVAEPAKADKADKQSKDTTPVQ